MTSHHCFALIVGSGFAGSLLAWIMARQGRDAVIVDRSAHPRFAIGESSTPTADFLLAHLSERWNLPELLPLASFGQWQATYPELRCGNKRGFSYFGHSPNQPFVDDARHSRSLLVAASATDEWSDTHWYRSDVDAFLATQARAAGATLHEQTTIEAAEWDVAQSAWIVNLNTNGRRTQVIAEWLIDASGSGHATARWLGHQSDDAWMRTRSSALFGHFDGVASFSDTLENASMQREACFDADNAAQHHVISNGWYWVLRFLGGRTSVGLVRPQVETPLQLNTDQHLNLDATWAEHLASYPSISAMMRDTKLVDPKSANGLPSLSFIHRMSRCRNKAVGRNWILLPVAYGFIDPLHSFGIAHSLSGIARVADALLTNESSAATKLEAYDRDLRREIEWFDTIISGSYRGLPSYERFVAFANFYFAATIGFEEQLAADPTHWPSGFMNASNEPLRAAAESVWRCANVPASKRSDRDFADRIRVAIEPWNTVGLMSVQRNNRFSHTTPPKRRIALH